MPKNEIGPCGVATTPSGKIPDGVVPSSLRRCSIARMPWRPTRATVCANVHRHASWLTVAMAKVAVVDDVVGRTTMIHCDAVGLVCVNACSNAASQPANAGLSTAGAEGNGPACVLPVGRAGAETEAGALIWIPDTATSPPER